ncbi:MAG TPA: carboxylating nicotinate-nucleotide diphosphorylase [Thermoplasmatales archaeon]|nr:carboxylating nicotinate-nucleotide diphosphorylase [Thermoplasmatales archaeon]
MDDIGWFLKEDLDEKGDITSDALFSNETTEAKIIAKQDCIVAGLQEATQVFKKTGAQTISRAKDGDFVKKNTVVAVIKGPARAILKGERLSLNFICRMSGIATETRKLVEKCRKINPDLKIMATRKTTPGFRKYEKKAVKLGGGDPHRMGLYDAVMIKDNHIRIAGSIEKAIRTLQEKIPDKPIEVEVETEKDAVKAAELKADIIMLDNFQPEDAEKTTHKIKEINPNVLVEISGGVTPDNITEYAAFADRISLGYLTHSIKSRDFSLEIV